MMEAYSDILYLVEKMMKNSSVGVEIRILKALKIFRWKVMTLQHWVFQL